eukprot:COSAG02_NODE_2146_length_9670_cov_7.714136_3_plen_245_part_00
MTFPDLQCDACSCRRECSVLCSLDSTFVGIAAARGRLMYSGRGGDRLGRRRTHTERVTVDTSAELAACARKAVLRLPAGEETTRSVDVATQNSGHSLAVGSSGVSLEELSTTTAALVTTRREISLRSIRHDRAARRSDLCTPRLVPPGRFVSEATVRRLVKRCQEDVANQKREEDEIEQARIDVELRQLAEKENERLAAEAKAIEERKRKEAQLATQAEAAAMWRVSTEYVRAFDHLMYCCSCC